MNDVAQTIAIKSEDVDKKDIEIHSLENDFPKRIKKIRNSMYISFSIIQFTLKTDKQAQKHMKHTEILKKAPLCMRLRIIAN